MPDLFNFTPEMSRFFDRLPEHIQEALMHGGAKINSLDDLKAATKECLDNEDA